MATTIIGNNTENVGFDITLDDSYAHNLSAYQVYVPAGKELVKVHLYQGSGVSGKHATVGLYDMSSGANNSTLVSGTSQSFVSDSTEEWKTVDLTGSEVALTGNKTYGLGIWSSDEWEGDISGGWVSNNNIRQNNTGALPATFVLDDSSYNGGAIAMYAEIQDVAGSSPAITSVNGGSSVADGDEGVNIAGIDFDASTNIVTSSPSVDINDANAVVQSTVSTVSTSSINITVDLPAGSDEVDPVYFFVTDTSSNVSAAFNVAVTAEVTATLCTMSFEDADPPTVNAGSFSVSQLYEILVPGDTDFTAIGAADNNAGTRFTATGVGAGTGAALEINAAEVESTNFALDVSVSVYRAGGSTEEVATVITAVDTLPTATPKINVTFPNGDPDYVNNDVIKISYTSIADGGAGDIKETTEGIPLASFTNFVGTTCA